MRSSAPQLLSAVRAAALIGLAIQGAATAQCPVPDGLSPGPCCTIATPNVPRLPNFSQQVLSICWLDCKVEAVGTFKASWSSPTPPDDCRNYAKRLRIRDAGGTTHWNGRIKLRYSRTWVETDPSGVERQVYRYLANGDMAPTAAAGVPPCPVPSCVPVFGVARFTGYVDYALDCSTGLEEYAWMLEHACDGIDHSPGFPRSGVFHPDRSFTFVGPSAGFVVDGIQPVASGAGFLEALRRIDRPTGSNQDFCQFDESLLENTLQPLSMECMCGPATGPLQFATSYLLVLGACGSTVTTPGGPYLPGYVSKGIGMWTDPFVFPGEEILRWSAGGYAYGDPCTGVVRDEVFFGVTTLRGWPAHQVPTPVDPGVTLPEIFVDQGNSLAGNTGTTMNRPYRSDHVLNLNY